MALVIIYQNFVVMRGFFFLPIIIVKLREQPAVLSLLFLAQKNAPRAALLMLCIQKTSCFDFRCSSRDEICLARTYLIYPRWLFSRANGKPQHAMMVGTTTTHIAHQQRPTAWRVDYVRSEPESELSFFSVPEEAQLSESNDNDWWRSVWRGDFNDI